MADDNLNKQKVENVESNDKGGAAESGDKFREEVFGAAGAKVGAISDSLTNNSKSDKDSGLPKLELGDDKDKQVEKRKQGEEGKSSKEHEDLKKGTGENNAKSDKDNSSKDQERNKNGAEVDPVTQQHEFHHGQVNKMPDDAKTNRLDKENSEAAGKTDKLQDALNPKADSLGKIGNELKNQEISDKIGDMSAQSHAESSEEIKDGVEELPTGDHIVREDGKESLFTPDGDRITLNPDGSNTIKGDNVKKVVTDRDGVTTVSFKDGAEVSFDAEGFRSVTRGNQGVSFGRMEGQGGGGGGKGGDGPHSEGPGAPKIPHAENSSASAGKDRNKMSSDERVADDLRRIEKIAPGLLEKKFGN